MAKIVNASQRFITQSCQLDNKDSAEITIMLRHSKTIEDVLYSDYSLVYKSYFGTMKKQISITSSNIGEGSIKAVCEAIKSIEGTKYTRFIIYFDNLYIIKMFENLNSLVRFKKVYNLKNKDALLEFYRLMQTIGRKHYITLKKEKVIKVYQEKPIS